MMIPSFLIVCLFYIVSFFFVLGVDDWFLVWVGLEINMMGFIGMAFFRYNKGCVESLYSYFFVQSAASGGFLVLIYAGGLVSLMLVLSIAGGPFYFWLPSVMMGLSWFVNFVLMTFQKLLPLMLISGVGGVEMWGLGVLSLVVGVLGSFNQKFLSKLMAYSSVSHVGWMILAQEVGGVVWMLYYVVYVVVLFVLVSYLVSMGKDEMNEMVGIDFMFVFFMLNLAGMPPMLGFVSKWMVFSFMVEVDFLVSLMMVISSLVMFYVYVRVSYEGLVGGVDGLLGEDMKVLGWSVGGLVVLVSSVFLPPLVWCMF